VAYALQFHEKTVAAYLFNLDLSREGRLSVRPIRVQGPASPQRQARAGGPSPLLGAAGLRGMFPPSYAEDRTKA